jgi:hypothetical protein
MRRLLGICTGLLCLPLAAMAQRLPSVAPPGLPPALPSTLPEPLPRGLPPAAGEHLPLEMRPVRAAVERLPRVVPAAVRRQARQLLRDHPRELERDPRGAPIMRAVVIALSPDALALQRAQARGYVIQEERELAELQQRIVTLLVPAGTETEAALRELRAADPSGQYDFDHLYVESGPATAAADGAAIPAPVQPAAGMASGMRVGLIDGGIDTAHPVFRHRPPQVSGCGGHSQPSGHGTAVASLFVGWSEDFTGLRRARSCWPLTFTAAGRRPAGACATWCRGSPNSPRPRRASST